MSKDPHLQRLLDDINLYIDNMPAPGSPEYLRFMELCDELAGHRAAAADHPLSPELDELGRKIEATVQRHEREKHADDLSPGGEGMARMIGDRSWTSLNPTTGQRSEELFAQCDTTERLSPTSLCANS